MAKIVVERPRLGHSDRTVRGGRTRALTDDDGEPLRARTPVRTRPERTKTLNENLAPLKRYLAAQVGRPWNKVYSEISAHLKPTSTVQQHVRDHLGDFVAVNTCMIEGKVHLHPRFGGPRLLAEDRCLFYVHPKTGLLKRNTQRRGSSFYAAQRAAAQGVSNLRRRVVNGSLQYLLLDDGGWWAVTLAPTAFASEGAVDVVLRDGLSSLAPEALYGRPDVYARHKRALTKAEKDALKLG